jgi:hypothetical protein
MRLARAAVLSIICCWVGIAPPPAAQSLGSLIVAVSSPEPGSTVTGSITVSASVTIVGSLTVAGVQFKLDGTNLGAEDRSAPYTVSWNTTTTSNGSHTLTAVARDLLGLQWTSNPVTVTVSNDITPPTVSITSPSPGSTVSGTISMTASASDNVGVVGVQFRLDGANFGTEDTSAPYSVSWDTTTASNGSHTLTARARDAAGNATTSSAVTVTVSNDTSPPIVTITSPASGSTVSGTVTVTASASDNVGVAGVQFTLDGANLGAEDTSAPYAVSWNTSTASNGSHTLTARARDAAGNATTSSAVTVTVSNDTTAPTVTITSPASGSTVSGTITVTASASDNIGVAGVQFTLDGANLGAEDTSAPYAVSWDTSTASNGSHTLTARARDAAGNVTTSSAVTVTVSNDTTPPAVTITSPASGSTVSGTITVTASASDNIGVAGVQFTLDGVSLGAEDTSAPYAVSWDTSTASDGSHTLTARARDAAGNATTSDPVTVTVSNGPPPDTTPPTVSITSPSVGSAVCGTISVTASASDNVGVAGVQFRLDSADLGAEDISAPFAVSWNSTSASNGSHTLTAQARDAAGNIGSSSAVPITVSNDGSDCTAPTVTIDSPRSGSTVAGTITVSASASDDVGVMGVEFRINGASGVEDTTAPYAISWNTTSASNGSHTLTAIARDAAGNRTTSAPVTVTVSNDPTPPECASPLDAFPGSTLFNNTVRAQMWVIDDTWWSAFSDAATGIYFYKLVGSSFVKGDFIDPSFAAGKPDTLWNGSELFVLVQQSGSLAKLYKYSYSATSQSFALISGFPIDLPLAGLAAAVPLHQDSTGKVWATYTSGSNVYVIWSTSADHRTWDTTGVILAPDISALTTEVAAITHFGGDKIGVVWGNQNMAEYAFRFHRDGDAETNWSAKEIVDCCSPDGSVADDHLSLRAAPDGRLFLVAKDSIDSGNLHLFVRGVDGSWGQKTAIDSDPLTQPTRPTLALHVDNDHAYVLYRNSTDGQTYLSRSAMSSPGFGLRCVFLTHGTSVTSTKQNVNSSTGLVAAHSDTGQIFAARIELAATASSAMAASGGERTAAPTGPAPTMNSDDRRGQLRKEAGSVVGATAAGAWPPDGTPVPGFERIQAGGLSTSEAPVNDSQWWWLRGQGINTIVNLDAVMYDFAQYGFESFLWMPVGAGGTPSEEEVRSFLNFIRSCDNEPAHISGGAPDRRAMLVALLRYAIDAWSIEDALAEGQRLNGGAALSSEQIAWLQGWSAGHLPGSERRGSCSAQ